MNAKKAKALRREAKNALNDSAKPMERKLYQKAKEVYRKKKK